MIEYFLGDVMGRKGFTLVELIATVAIVSLVLGIAGYSVIGIINNSNNRSEEVFVEKIDNAIFEYVGLYGGKLKKGNVSYEFNKCLLLSCDAEDKYEKVKVYELFNSNSQMVKLSVLLDENFFDNDKLVNPVNKENCLVDKNPDIRIFRDDDYVYYYYVDLRGNNTNCGISDENGIINTLPDELKIKVGI